MAIPALWNPDRKGTLVGVRVYEPYSPSKLGIIVEDLGEGVIGKSIVTGHIVKVFWIKTKKITEHYTLYLNDFDCLIAETEKKLNTHLSNRDKIDKIYNSFLKGE
jgi:hypothetical protein